MNDISTIILMLCLFASSMCSIYLFVNYKYYRKMCLRIGRMIMIDRTTVEKLRCPECKSKIHEKNGVLECMQQYGECSFADTPLPKSSLILPKDGE